MITLDTLRTKYSSASPWLRLLAGKTLRFMPPQLQYGRNYFKTLEQIARSQTDSSFVEYQQNLHFNHLIQAANKTRYFSQLFDRLGIFPTQISDLSKLPILTKELIRKHGLNEFVAQPPTRLDLVSSSGSSGLPFSIYLDKDRSVREWAFINHVWGRIGFRPGHIRAVLRDMRIEVGSGGENWSYDPALRELKLSTLRLTTDGMDHYLELLDRFKVNFIHGYPSAIFILALHAKRRNWTPSKSLLGILPISEAMFHEQRDLISKAFGQVPVLSFYGLSEKVALAGELLPDQGELPGCYEFEPLYGRTEIVDHDNQPVNEGQTGRIIATGFLCKGQPMIRYDTGDVATLVRAATKENCYRLRVKKLASRWTQEYLVGSSGSCIPLTALITPSQEYSQIRQMQYHQSARGIVTLKIVPLDSSITAANFSRIVNETALKTENDLHLRVEIVEEINSNLRGKTKFIDQELNLNLITPDNKINC